MDWLFIEQTALTFLLGYQTQVNFFDVLTCCNNVIYSSDLGQTSQIDVEDWRMISKSWFEQASLPESRVEEIALDNPLSMLAN